MLRGSYYNLGVLPQIAYSSLLGCSTRQRLVEVGCNLGISLPHSARKERKIEAFFGSAPQLAPLVGPLQRDELKVICQQHASPDRGRANLALARLVLVAAGESDVAPARHRQFLVEPVRPQVRPRLAGPDRLRRTGCA